MPCAMAVRVPKRRSVALSIRRKFILVFSAIIAGLLCFGTFALTRVNALHLQTDVVSSDVAAIQRLASVQSGMERSQVLYGLTSFAPDQDAWEAMVKTLHPVETAMSASWSVHGVRSP